MQKRISRLRRLADEHGYALRRWRNQISDDCWDLFDVQHGGAVFSGHVQGCMGTSLDAVEAYLS